MTTTLHRHIAYQRVGQHRGKRRVWLEGKRLTDAGLVPGARYELQYDQPQGALHIRLFDEGSRAVSSREKSGKTLPIIEINTHELSRTIGDATTQVRVIFSDGQVDITVHPVTLAARERLARLMGKLEAGEPLLHGSLFTGAGVLDHAVVTGLRLEGVQTKPAFVAELDPAYLDISLEHNPALKGALSIEGSVAEVETSLLPKVEILVAGLPCTAVSRAGRAKKGAAWRATAARNGHGTKNAQEGHSSQSDEPVVPEADEHAGGLFIALLRILEATQPAVVVVENVPLFSGTAGFYALCQVMRDWQYTVSTTVLGGNEYGCLENRERLCIVATSSGIPFTWDGILPVRTKEPTLGDVLEPMADDDPRWRHYAYLAAKEKTDLAAGKGFLMQLVDSDSSSIGTVGRGYQKFRQTEPLIKHPVDAKRVRLLTLDEHRQVKGIPEGLLPLDQLGLVQGHALLGQSVCWPVFAAVGKHLGTILKATARGGSDLTLPPQPLVYRQVDLFAGALG